MRTIKYISRFKRDYSRKKSGMHNCQLSLSLTCMYTHASYSGERELSKKETEFPYTEKDKAGMHVDWSTRQGELPGPKAALKMRVDYEVLEFFSCNSKGDRKKINSILRYDIEQKQCRRMDA